LNTKFARHRRRGAGSWLVALGVALALAESALAADNDIPRTADGTPDLSGIWKVLENVDYDLEPHHGREDAPPGRGVVEGGKIPYQPWALEKRAENFASRHVLDPRLKCYTLGTPRGQYYPEPFQIFQRPRDITILYQFGHSVRTIHTNGTKAPEGGNRLYWLGDSRGRWEGDTLVVDVTHFNDKTWFDRAGNFHSEALHVVERWTPIGPDHIEYQATIHDPKVFTRPWTINVLLYRQKEENFQLIENYCFTHEYDEFYPLPDIEELAVLPDGQ